jgi:hypothetical protein
MKNVARRGTKSQHEIGSKQTSAFYRRFREKCHFQPQRRRINKALLATCSMLVSCLAYSWTLKMYATFSSETSVDFQRTTPHYTPEDIILHDHRCENLKFCMLHELFVSLMRAPYPAYLTDFHFISLIVFSEELKLSRSSSYHFLQPPDTSCLSGISLGSFLLYTLNQVVRS